MARFTAATEVMMVTKDQGFTNPATPKPDAAYR
jgi:hypothetical protein